jgi:tetratricopeptide (TPR) repeat protein
MDRKLKQESLRNPPSDKPDLPHLLDEGLARHQAGDLAEAKRIYSQILQVQPDRSDAIHLLGVIALQSGKSQEAADLISRSIQLNGEVSAAHTNLGLALKGLNRLDEALSCFDRASILASDNGYAQINRGATLQELGRLEEALGCFDKVIESGQLLPEAHNNRGTTLKGLNRLDEALASFDYAISLASDFADAHLNRSLLLLLLGELERGWESYEWRWKVRDFPSPPRHFAQALWLGNESLQGKVILLHAEQGLGDTIQFCRYAKLVKQLGATVILEVPRALVELMGCLEGVDALVANGDPLPPFDVHCPLLSLPLVFRTTLNSIPQSVPYLKCSEDYRRLWAGRLGHKTKSRVGLAWRGNKNYKDDTKRSLALANLLPHLPDSCDYFCLHKDVNDKEIAELNHSRIKYFGEELTFSHTAALIDFMDIVVSTDTSIPHLSAAMGKPTWLLLPLTPDWRWLLHRNDSPWYPTMKLFRQSKDPGWEDVLSELSFKLRSL